MCAWSLRCSVPELCPVPAAAAALGVLPPRPGQAGGSGAPCRPEATAPAPAGPLPAQVGRQLLAELPVGQLQAPAGLACAPRRPLGLLQALAELPVPLLQGGHLSLQPLHVVLLLQQGPLHRGAQELRGVGAGEATRGRAPAGTDHRHGRQSTTALRPPPSASPLPPGTAPPVPSSGLLGRLKRYKSSCHSHPEGKELRGKGTCETEARDKAFGWVTGRRNSRSAHSQGDKCQSEAQRLPFATGWGHRR